MKAKELYAAHFAPIADKTRVEHIDGIAKILNELLSEIREIAEKRNATSNQAMCAIVDEQERKWWAVVKLIDKSHSMPGDLPEHLNRLFEEYTKKLLPEVHGLWMKIRDIEMKKKAPPRNVGIFDDDFHEDFF